MGILYIYSSGTRWEVLCTEPPPPAFLGAVRTEGHDFAGMVFYLYLVVWGLDWVGDWLTFYLQPNGLLTINMTLTNGDDGRTWVVGREFESNVHHEIAFQRKKSECPVMSRIWKIASGSPPKLEPRVVARRPVKSGPFQGGRECFMRLRLGY